MRSCRRDEECSSSLRRASYKKLRKIGYFFIDYGIDFKKIYRLSTFHAYARERRRTRKPPGPSGSGLLFLLSLDVRCHFMAYMKTSDVIFWKFPAKIAPGGHDPASKTGFFRSQSATRHPQSHFSRVAGLLAHVSACGRVFIPPDGRRA